MSGGSLNYRYFQIEELADDILEQADTQLQKDFANHLYKIAKAAHDIEWVLSKDYTDGDDVESIKQALFRDSDDFKWTEDKVIDFINWYIDLHDLGLNYKLENEDIIKSFKRGDSPSVWKRKNEWQNKTIEELIETLNHIIPKISEHIESNLDNIEYHSAYYRVNEYDIDLKVIINRQLTLDEYCELKRFVVEIELLWMNLINKDCRISFLDCDPDTIDYSVLESDGFMQLKNNK